MVGVSVFILIPYLDVVRRSFAGAVSQTFTGVQNYITVLTNPAFRLACKNTVRFAAVCIPLLIVLSLAIAVFLQRQGPWGQRLKSVYLIPMAIPAASVVLIWKLVFDRHGLLNGILSGLHVNTMDWMNTGAAFWVLVFSYIWKNLGYDVILWIAGLGTISENIYEAARVDGAGEWNLFLRITMPNLLPSLYTISVLSFLNSFKVFREAYLVAGDYPNDSMYLLQHLYNNWFRDLSMDKMAAGAVLMTVVVSLLVLLLEKAWGKDIE
ncbi:MAG: sugar ABC transporter permease [Hespellia sp.]|nr:sugar ABC transporter permease [Hespellia sp.]